MTPSALSISRYDRAVVEVPPGVVVEVGRHAHPHVPPPARLPVLEYDGGQLASFADARTVAEEEARGGAVRQRLLVPLARVGDRLQLQRRERIVGHRRIHDTGQQALTAAREARGVDEGERGGLDHGVGVVGAAIPVTRPVRLEEVFLLLVLGSTDRLAVDPISAPAAPIRGLRRVAGRRAQPVCRGPSCLFSRGRRSRLLPLLPQLYRLRLAPGIGPRGDPARLRRRCMAMRVARLRGTLVVHAVFGPVGAGGCLVVTTVAVTVTTVERRRTGAPLVIEAVGAGVRGAAKRVEAALLNHLHLVVRHARVLVSAG
eukprot:4900719-Prymnesium_polylepis.1